MTREKLEVERRELIALKQLEDLVLELQASKQALANLRSQQGSPSPSAEWQSAESTSSSLSEELEPELLGMISRMRKGRVMSSTPPPQQPPPQSIWKPAAYVKPTTTSTSSNVN